MLEQTPDGHGTQVDPMVVSPFYHYVTLFPYWNNVLPSNRQGVPQCHRAGILGSDNHCAHPKSVDDDSDVRGRAHGLRSTESVLTVRERGGTGLARIEATLQPAQIVDRARSSSSTSLGCMRASGRLRMIRLKPRGHLVQTEDVVNGPHTLKNVDAAYEHGSRRYFPCYSCKYKLNRCRQSPLRITSMLRFGTMCWRSTPVDPAHRATGYVAVGADGHLCGRRVLTRWVQGASARTDAGSVRPIEARDTRPPAD